MRRRARTLGTICALMQRRLAALRYFTPLAVDGFLAAIVRSLSLEEGSGPTARWLGLVKVAHYRLLSGSDRSSGMITLLPEFR